jgi:type VI secretion system protein VasG
VISGEFENRLKSLVEEVKRSPIPIILFIDEAHTMIGAGGAAGQNDAANILKPALARGELRTIAATTWSEYKKYFEKDPALARRFQVVKVEEPSEEQCLVMLRGITGVLEKHHKVRILDEGVAAAVKLSHRYIAGRQLPDKAVSVLDTACARLALGHSSTPAAIEDLKRQIDDLDVQERVLLRETATGVDHAERLQSVLDQKAAAAKSLEEINAKWEQVSKLVGEIREVRGKLESPPPENIDPDALRQKLADLNRQLDTLQGETPLLQVCVDSQIVGQVISGWTGIPLGKMVRDEIGTVLELDQHLAKRVIGQDYPLKLIGQRIQTGRASLDDPGKPLGVFMLIGPSGVGKTETALALSDLLYGGEHNLISINMSEFQEAHTVSTLKGSPPGYVGYGEGGVLTEAVRRRPYSVVLLDEVEKAHPDVLELFYQVFDKGHMEDGEGREIDFKNTIIILTTNACTDQMTKLTSDPDTMPGPEVLVKTLKPELNKIFKPAFLGRMVIIPFYPIRDEVLKKIIELKLGRIQRRMVDNHKIELKYDSAVVDEVAKRCTEVESGARNVDNILTNTLLPDISRQLLTSIAEGRKLSSVTVGIGGDGAFRYS